MTNVKPILDKVLVQIEKAEQKTESGLILTSQANESKPIIGQVIARGPGGVINGKEVKMCVEAGEKVIINKYAGTDIKIDGKECKIVSQQDVLARIL